MTNTLIHKTYEQDGRENCEFPVLLLGEKKFLAPPVQTSFSDQVLPPPPPPPPQNKRSPLNMFIIFSDIFSKSVLASIMRKLNRKDMVKPLNLGH